MLIRAALAGVLMLASASAWADSTIDLLGAGGALGGSEKIPMFQTANPAVSTTAAAIKTFTSASPTLVTPALGTPASGLLSNATGLPLTTGITGILAGVNGGTGVANTGFTFTLGGSASLPAAPAGTQCLHMANTGAITATGADCVAGTVTSVGLSVPATSIFGATGTPVTTSGTLGLTTTGTSGGIPYFSSTSQLATSAALTANLPVIGGGAGVAPTVGTRSGNTTSFATTSGALTSGNCAKFDASGNVIDNGTTCGGAGGTGFGVDGGTSAAAVTGTGIIGNAVRLVKVASGWTTGTLTLPAISAVSADSAICIDDGAGFITGGATLTVAANALDGIGGGTVGGSVGPYTTAGAGICFRVSATHNWAIESSNTVAASSAPANQFANGIGANGLVYAQPAFSNISGTATIAQGGTGAASLAGHGAVVMNAGGTAQTVVAPGANNNCLVSNATDWTSAACPGGAGAVTLVSTQTATNSASLAWTGLTGTNYRVACSNIVPATNAQLLFVQFGEGGTPTWQTTTYLWAQTGLTTGGGAVTLASASDIGIALDGGGLQNSGQGFSGFGEFYNLAGTVIHQGVTHGFGVTGGGGFETITGGGFYNGNSTAITAIRVISQSGNLTSGSCSLYAIGT